MTFISAKGFRQVHALLMSSQVSANGNVLRSEIVGSIKMRVFLSGMPELRLGLNDKVLFENTGREFAFLSGSRARQTTPPHYLVVL